MEVNRLMNKLPEGLRSRLYKMNWHYMVLIVMIAVTFIVMSVTTRNFLSFANLSILVNNFIMEAIMALGMTLVIITGGSDISVSGILPFCAIMFAYMMQWGIPIALALILGILLGGLVGLVNNLLRRVLRIHPMIVTMAMQLTLRGLNLAITGGNVISGFPDGFAALAGFRPLGISLPVWLYILLAVFFLVFSKNNKLFLKVFFVGGNLEASRLSGIKTENVLRFVYVVNGLLAGLAGVLSTVVYNSASYSYGQGVELKVITAVAIGGTSMTHGGEGSIVGTMLGTLFLALIYNAFVQSGISTYYQDVFTGAMLIVAVLLSEVLRTLKKNSALQAAPEK